MDKPLISTTFTDEKIPYGGKGEVKKRVTSITLRQDEYTEGIIKDIWTVCEGRNIRDIKIESKGFDFEILNHCHLSGYNDGDFIENKKTFTVTTTYVIMEGSKR